MIRRIALGSTLCFLGALALVVPACSSTTPVEADAGPVGSKGPQLGADGHLAPPPPGSIELAFGPLTVPASTEHTKCITKRLDNNERIHVSRIQNRLGDASHHLIVYRVADTEEKATPYDCDPFADTLKPERGAPLMITQKYEEELALPPGVAFTLEPHQMIRLELHYLNASSEVKDVRTTSTFISIPDSEFKYEADFVFMGNPDIKLPPRSKSSLDSYIPMPETHEGVHFFAVTGHQHHFGKNVKVEVAESKDGPGRPVYDVKNWVWSEPATVFHDPPFDVPKGGGFRFRCDWDNTSDQTVKFGEKTTDEMCFFWGYYYPSVGPQVCVHTEQTKVPTDLCCPGDTRCVFLDL